MYITVNNYFRFQLWKLSLENLLLHFKKLNQEKLKQILNLYNFIVNSKKTHLTESVCDSKSVGIIHIFTIFRRYRAKPMLYYPVPPSGEGSDDYSPLSNMWLL